MPSPAHTPPLPVVARRLGLQPTLPLQPSEPLTLSRDASTYPTALEDRNFPFEEISDIAELESWRKEINRPTYYIHKWWARRLGSVFRAIILATFLPKGANVSRFFYRPVRIPDAVIYDPFMGSGITVGESVKMGARSIGRDINPVAHFLAKNAVTIHDRTAVHEEFRRIEHDVAPQILRYYQSSLPRGEQANVLYYFWVSVVQCPSCNTPVDLFSSYVFAQHASPGQRPNAQALCPCCGALNQVRYDAIDVCCAQCGSFYNPQVGSVNGKMATCFKCATVFPVAKTIRSASAPPSHRLYAKMLFAPDGRKFYLPATEEDHELYRQAQGALDDRKDAYPIVPIRPGYNTDQVLRYNYRHWHELFNDRQLLCLSILAERIESISDVHLRDLFVCLFSGSLEFNNLFASYKGEGTGAVRHMFSHHILKPERVPLEANPWGTPKSSGAFSTLFSSRIERALEYADNPFELALHRRQSGRKYGRKIFGLSECIGHDIAVNFPLFSAGKRVYLSCGDSSTTDIPDQSVDAVITDPPFFDNVHYSQLADFFYVWQRHVLAPGPLRTDCTTRRDGEVQSNDRDVFMNRLAAVLQESARVLKYKGVLALTYHQSKIDGWSALLQALIRSGFAVTAVQPIRGEMSVAIPKRRTKNPINLDVILVCRKRREFCRETDVENTVTTALQEAEYQIRRFAAAGRELSDGDMRVVMMAQLLKPLSDLESEDDALEIIAGIRSSVERISQRLRRELVTGATDHTKRRE